MLVSYNKLMDIIKSELNVSDFLLWDKDYYIVDAELFFRVYKKWIVWFHYNRLPWMAEMYDCDDFARTFQDYMIRNIVKEIRLMKLREALEKGCSVIPLGGIPVFKVLGFIELDGEEYCHMWNVAVYRFGNYVHVQMIEPQTGELLMHNRSEDGWVYKPLKVIG